ncbi:MAG: hypothetical protein IPH04_03770 [Saprospirales bacterium]|jgi:Flp pilus assembly protein TadB|nr:hypothetical protein [Saprospirales bacterium]MBK6901940.1 hypothetical protein [Saprospirales bacterium]
MKNLNILSLLVIVSLLFAVQPASAVVSVQNSKETTSISKKDLKKQERMEKLMDKIQKKMDKMESKGIDKNDPVGKWLWFAILAWILAIVLYILAAFTFGAFWYIAYLASLAGTIFFVIWLLKVLEVID